MPRNVLLFSIRPEYAVKIFCEKTKKVELRRIRPRLMEEGDLVIVYVSSPKKALVGSFEVKKIIEEPLPKLWVKVEKTACISRKDFDIYYSDRTVGIGIYIENIQSYNEPVTLQILRENINNFHPPQSYRYLRDKEIEVLKSLVN
jgi:predicted transcriptional regulator